MPHFEAYHGKDSQFHQQRFNALAPDGWRMISLSAHGAPSSPRYSAVWVREPGPGYVGVHDLPIRRYQQWFDDQTKAGFAPVLLAATGGGANAVVAAVFEKGVKPGWVAKHGLGSGADDDQNTAEFWCKKARQDGLVLRSGSIYGSASQRLPAAWPPRPTDAYQACIVLWTGKTRGCTAMLALWSAWPSFSWKNLFAAMATEVPPVLAEGPSRGSRAGAHRGARTAEACPSAQRIGDRVGFVPWPGTPARGRSRESR